MAIESNRIVRASGVFLLAAACLGGGCAIINRMDGVAESRAVQKTGIPADARILQMSETRMVLNQRYPVVRFLLEVHPPNGAPYQATTKCPISLLDVPRLQPGKMVPISIDRRDPSKVALGLYKF
jgi:hypothetical protein